MTTSNIDTRGLYRSWVLANGIGEMLGLGTTALAGWAAFTSIDDGTDPARAILVVLSLIAVAAVCEGVIVGVLQGRVINRYLGNVPVGRWASATVIGAAIAWTLGMIPSTVMGIGGTTGSGGGAPQEPELWAVLLMAAGMGALLGPVLGIPQWRALRGSVPRAGRWVWANVLAWAAGMPVIFLGTGTIEEYSSTLTVVAVLVGSFLAAGLVVGAVHGVVLKRMVEESEDLGIEN